MSLRTTTRQLRTCLTCETGFLYNLEFAIWIDSFLVHVLAFKLRHEEFIQIYNIFFYIENLS